MSPSQILGYARMAEAIRSREDLSALVGKLFSQRENPSDTALFAGAVACLVEVYGAAVDAGYRARTTDRQAQAFLSGGRARIAVDLTCALNDGDTQLLAQRVGALCSVATQLRGKVAFTLAQDRAEIPPEPLAVRVESLPKRITTAEIFRDSETLEIIKTVHTEVDA